jgi:hypothetical protein
VFDPPVVLFCTPSLLVATVERPSVDDPLVAASSSKPCGIHSVAPVVV